MRAGAAHTLEIMRHWPLGALRRRSRTVNIGARRRYGDSFAHFTIEDFQCLYRVLHGYNFFNVVIVQKKRHPPPPESFSLFVLVTITSHEHGHVVFFSPVYPAVASPSESLSLILLLLPTRKPFPPPRRTARPVYCLSRS